MTIDTGNLLEPTNVRKPGDFARNHMGAPYVTHPTETKADGSPKRVVYGRPSSFGTALDNAYNLVKWKERQLLIGAMILDTEAYGDEVEDPIMHIDPDDRDALDAMAARCHQAAGSHLAADQGTHIHLLLEHNDRDVIPEVLFDAGEELGLPGALQFQIVAQWNNFRAELGVTALAIEATIVNDDWRLAGTLDRLDICNHDLLTGYGIIPTGCPFIGDIKTGGLTLGRDGQPNYWVKYPVQLAAYAHGQPYDVETDERDYWPLERPHQEIGIIYHYDLARALTGEPVDWQAIPVNLEAGRQGGNLCRQAADFSKRRDLFLMPTPKNADQAAQESGFLVSQAGGVIPESPSTTGEGSTPAPDAPPPAALVDDFHIVVSDGRRGSVTVPTSRTYIHTKVRELATAGHESVIRAMWPQGVPPLTDTSHTVEQLTQLFHMVRRVETEVSAPFDPEPVTHPERQHCAIHDETYINLCFGCQEDAMRAELAPDDGAFLDQREINLLKERMLALPDHRHIQLAAIAREAADAGRPISVKQKPCVRRWELTRALVLWAEIGGSDIDALWLNATIVATEKQITSDDITLGALISQFTIEQACRLADSFQPGN